MYGSGSTHQKASYYYKWSVNNYQKFQSSENDYFLRRFERIPVSNRLIYKCVIQNYSIFFDIVYKLSGAFKLILIKFPKKSNKKWADIAEQNEKHWKIVYRTNFDDRALHIEHALYGFYFQFYFVCNLVSSDKNVTSIDLFFLQLCKRRAYEIGYFF